MIHAHDSLSEAIAELTASQKFRDWKSKKQVAEEKHYTPQELARRALRLEQAAEEKHYTPDDLADLWGVSAETIRNIFRNEPGVLRVTHPNEKKRKYVLIRIPDSVAERVHKRLSAVSQ